MPTEPDTNQMPSTDDAAKLMGLQPCTLAAWREDGSQPDLAFFKIGKAVRYRYGDVIAFLNARRAISTLAARQMKNVAVATTADPGPPVQAKAPSRKAKPRKPASERAVTDEQQTLF